MCVHLHLGILKKALRRAILAIVSETENQLHIAFRLFFSDFFGL